MSKIFNLLMLAIVALVLPASCSKEDPFADSEAIGKTGTVNFRKMLVEVNSSEQEVRADVDVAAFLVEVTKNGSATPEYSGTYASLPEVLTLPLGDYKVVVKSPANPDAAWESPYFEGSRSFTIEENKVTDVETVVCKLGNVKVTVRYDSKLLPYMADDCVVTVKCGTATGGSLEFTKTETRSGHFRYYEGNNSLVASFKGTVEDNAEENLRTYTDVQPGKHYIITYRLHTPGGEPPAVEGTIAATSEGITVDAVVEEVDMNANINTEDEILDDTDRPQQGEDEPDPGTKPDDPQPSNPAPTITATINGVVNPDGPVTVTGEMNVLVKVDSQADGGVTVFKVDIVSTTLTPDELAGVQLSDKLDLINPGEFEDALKRFGFPVGNEVKGVKDVPQFDISTLVPLLNMLGPGDHKFILTVSDANGTTVRTLHFITE